MTEREKEVLQYVIDFKRTNGFSPTVREIATGINTHSIPHVKNMLECLQDEGFISMKPRSPRTIVVKKFIS